MTRRTRTEMEKVVYFDVCVCQLRAKRATLSGPIGCAELVSKGCVHECTRGLSWYGALAAKNGSGKALSLCTTSRWRPIAEVYF
jgi:hypothetical protein